MLYDLDGKVAVVTGGARGIGLAISKALAAIKAKVALVDLQLEQTRQAASLLQENNGTAMAAVADVTAPEQVQAMVKAVHDRWGRIDILVNNAGICPMTPIEDITAEEWDLVMGVNLKGAFLCSQAVIPMMRRQGSGKIINIASSAGQMGGLAVGLHYSASKAGMLGLTKSLARILAPAIQVNAVAPGTTESEMTRSWESTAVERIIKQIPAGRLGRPDDVAAAVSFLTSPAADFITGQTLSVNGGLLMV
jgi:3-oxoacyl-[acyl-carrier protein] reductase